MRASIRHPGIQTNTIINPPKMIPKRKDALKLSCYGGLILILSMGLSSFVFTFLVTDPPLTELGKHLESEYSTFLSQPTISVSTQTYPQLKRDWPNTTSISPTHSISSTNFLQTMPTCTSQLHLPLDTTAIVSLAASNSSSRVEIHKASTLDTSLAKVNSGGSSEIGSTSHSPALDSTDSLFTKTIQVSSHTAHVKYSTVSLPIAHVTTVWNLVPVTISTSITVQSTFITETRPVPFPATIQPSNLSSNTGSSPTLSVVQASEMADSPSHTTTLPALSITSSTTCLITTLIRQVDPTPLRELEFATTLATFQSVEIVTDISAPRSTILASNKATQSFSNSILRIPALTTITIFPELITTQFPTAVPTQSLPSMTIPTSFSQSLTTVTQSSTSQIATASFPIPQPAWVSQKPQNSSLSNGQILGICVGIILLIFIIILFLFFCIPRLKRKLKQRKGETRNPYYGTCGQGIEMSRHPRHYRDPSIGSVKTSIGTGKTLVNHIYSASRSSIIDFEDKIGEHGWDRQLTSQKSHSVDMCICSGCCCKKKHIKEGAAQLAEAIDQWSLKQYPTRAHFKRCDHDWVSTERGNAGAHPQNVRYSVAHSKGQLHLNASKRPVSYHPKGIPLSRPTSASKSLPPPNPKTFWKDLAAKNAKSDFTRAVSHASGAGSTDVESAKESVKDYSIYDTSTSPLGLGMSTSRGVAPGMGGTPSMNANEKLKLLHLRLGTRPVKHPQEDPKVAEVRRAVERVMARKAAVESIAKGKSGEAGAEAAERGSFASPGETRIVDVDEVSHCDVQEAWEHDIIYGSPLRTERRSMYGMQ